MAHAEAAPISSSFYETSLTFLPVSGHPGPVPGFTPRGAGSLSLSDTPVDYSITCDNGIPCVSSGDTDFSLDIGGIVLPVPPEPPPSWPLIMDGLVDIGTTPTLLSGTIRFDGEFDNLRMTISGNYVNGTIATDDDTLGCPDSQCSFTGIFPDISPATEPGSIAMLTTALGLLVFLGHCARCSSRVKAG